MMPAIPIAVGGLGLWYFFFRKPSASDFQVTQVMGAGGVPVKVATPVPKTATPSQVSGKTTPKPAGASKTVSQTGGTFAPTGAIVQQSPGSFQLAPTVITPSGASSVAIGSTLDIQRALNTLGYSPHLTEDGKLGPMTIANIKQFQGRNNLAVDGNAGPATKAALSAALTSLASGGDGTPAVAAAAVQQAQDSGTIDTSPANAMTAVGVQRALNQLGTSPQLQEDGKIGPKSVAAIKSFQLSHGLVADGVAGSKTKIALYTALVQASGGSPVTVSGDGTFSCGWS